MTHIIEIPFHIGDFLSGTMHMDGTEIGAYWMLCVAHYQAGEQGLPDDDVKLSRIAKVSLKTWRRIKPTIAEKFTITNSFWRQSKVIEVLRKVSELSSQNSAKSLKRWNGGDATALQRQSQPKTKNHKPIVSSKEDTPPDPPDIDAALVAYNRVAEQRHLPQVQKLTEARRRQLIARLEDCGGLSGWYAACEKLDDSLFCHGENDRGWKADFDFLVRESSFVKLMEGKYDNGGKKNGKLAREASDLLESIRDGSYC